LGDCQKEKEKLKRSPPEKERDTHRDKASGSTARGMDLATLNNEKGGEGELKECDPKGKGNKEANRTRVVPFVRRPRGGGKKTGKKALRVGWGKKRNGLGGECRLAKKDSQNQKKKAGRKREIQISWVGVQGKRHSASKVLARAHPGTVAKESTRRRQQTERFTFRFKRGGGVGEGNAKRVVSIADKGGRDDLNSGQSSKERGKDSKGGEKTGGFPRFVEAGDGCRNAAGGRRNYCPLKKGEGAKKKPKNKMAKMRSGDERKPGVNSLLFGASRTGMLPRVVQGSNQNRDSGMLKGQAKKEKKVRKSPGDGRSDWP